MGDYGRGMWPAPWGPYKPQFPPANPPAWPVFEIFPQQASPIPEKPHSGPTQAQFEEFLELLRAARKFDKATGQEDCPAEEKTGWMKDLARHLGLDPKRVEDALK